MNNILCLHRLGLQLGERVHYRQYPHQPCLGPGRWAGADPLSQLLRKGKTSHLQGHALDTRFMVPTRRGYHRQSSKLHFVTTPVSIVSSSVHTSPHPREKAACVQWTRGRVARNIGEI